VATRNPAGADLPEAKAVARRTRPEQPRGEDKGSGDQCRGTGRRAQESTTGYRLSMLMGFHKALGRNNPLGDR